ALVMGIGHGCSTPGLRVKSRPQSHVIQLPGLSTNPVGSPGNWCKEKEERRRAPAWDGCALRVSHLHNSNNNASPRGWLSQKGSHSLSPYGSKASTAGRRELSYVERVVLEIVESERMYVQDLRSIVECLPQVGTLGFSIPMYNIYVGPAWLWEAVVGSSLLWLYSLSFFLQSQDFDIYTQYCNNYPNSVAALTECMQNKQQVRFFRECQEQTQHALPLGAYLLKPVQRILKYHLLLQEIAKHFDLAESGYEVVEEAIDTMTCVAWYINDMKRKHEHAVRLQEIQSLLLNWKGPDLTTYGELVLEGTFRVQRVRNERAFFLFDKTLLITKKRGDHFIYKSHIPVPCCSCKHTRDSLCFSVTHYKHSKSVEEKRVWTHHIKRLILENHHAIIPQKVRRTGTPSQHPHPPQTTDPEGLKKARSNQPMDEVPVHIRHLPGRRQSGKRRGVVEQVQLVIGLVCPFPPSIYGVPTSHQQHAMLIDSHPYGWLNCAGPVNHWCMQNYIW
uniref:DH domain-containing protein n=1 Tax=Crocodylus porosus TaxID=8502 RepID=A0A7M4F6Z4_CROPO